MVTAGQVFREEGMKNSSHFNTCESLLLLFLLSLLKKFLEPGTRIATCSQLRQQETKTVTISLFCHLLTMILQQMEEALSTDNNREYTVFCLQFRNESLRE